MRVVIRMGVRVRGLGLGLELSTTSSSIVSAKRLAIASPFSPSTISPSMQNCVTVSHQEPCSIFLMPPEEVMVA